MILKPELNTIGGKKKLKKKFKTRLIKNKHPHRNKKLKMQLQK
jgi:hypothetical protein